MMARLPWGMAWIALVCCSTLRLPELPEIDLKQFPGEVGAALAKEYAEVKANPADADKVLHLGMLLHAHDQFQAAVQSYARVHAINAQRFETLYYWGNALASTGRYPEAAERLRQALKIRPASVP